MATLFRQPLSPVGPRCLVHVCGLRSDLVRCRHWLAVEGGRQNQRRGRARPVTLNCCYSRNVQWDGTGPCHPSIHSHTRSDRPSMHLDGLPPNTIILFGLRSSCSRFNPAALGMHGPDGEYHRRLAQVNGICTSLCPCHGRINAKRIKSSGEPDGHVALTSMCST